MWAEAPRIIGVRFEGIGVLQKAVLPLGQFTVIIGPNGSGKTTALKAIKVFQSPPISRWAFVTTDRAAVAVEFSGVSFVGGGSSLAYEEVKGSGRIIAGRADQGSEMYVTAVEITRSYQYYKLQADKISATAAVDNGALQEDVGNLVAFLDRMRDEAPERFDVINAVLPDWIPEFDKILFRIPHSGHKQLQVRLRSGEVVPANFVSDGSLLALALLAIAVAPNPPAIVAIEEPETGLHPRLLRLVADSLYRLSDTSVFDQARPPQVIVTTHSPYVLSCFGDRPECVVVAERGQGGATFSRLVDMPHFEEVIGDANLGQAWFAGALGGVPHIL